MGDKVDIEEEEKGVERDQHSHNIKTDPTKEEEHCNNHGDGVDEEDGGEVHSDSAVLRSMLTASSGVVGAHHINPPPENNTTTEGTRDVGARGGVLFVPGDSILQRSSLGSNNVAEVTAEVDVEATPVCPGESI